MLFVQEVLSVFYGSILWKLNKELFKINTIDFVLPLHLNYFFSIIESMKSINKISSSHWVNFVVKKSNVYYLLLIYLRSNILAKLYFDCFYPEAFQRLSGLIRVSYLIADLPSVLHMVTTHSRVPVSVTLLNSKEPWL